MPKVTKTYCDICGDEVSGDRLMLISTGTASKTTIEHTIEIDLKVTRQGPVNSISEPVGTMPHDEICFSCYYKIIQAYIKTANSGIAYVKSKVKC
jgi:hypothetical protein